MAEPFGDPLNPGSGKRPAPTIEGTATEVSMDPAPAETASATPEAGESKSDLGGSNAKRAKGIPPRTSPTERRPASLYSSHRAATVSLISLSCLDEDASAEAL